MFIFNLLFFLLGCAILGLGIWLKTEKGDYAQISSYNFLTAAHIAIAAGAIILVVSFLGCCGAIKEIKPMLLLFFIFLILIFILEITAGVLAYVKRDELEAKLEDDFKASINEKYGKPDEKGVTDAIDKFQETFKCCGFNNSKDWQSSYYYIQIKQRASIPTSCCKDRSNSRCGTMDRDINHHKGCYKEVKDFLKENLLIIGVCGIIFALIQILGMIFSMVLYCSIGDGGTYA